MSEDRRTLSQNNALHLYFRRVAKAMNDAGYDLKRTIKVMREDGVDISWSSEMVKEVLWRTIQQTMYHKYSTTRLRKQEEINDIFDVMSRFLAERLSIEPPAFPSLEELEKQND